MGALMAGQQAALGKYLAFSRGQEASADAAGAQYLSKAGITGRGSDQLLQAAPEQHGIPPGYTRNADSEFYSTHPVTSDRITNAGGHLPGSAPTLAKARNIYFCHFFASIFPQHRIFGFNINHQMRKGLIIFFEEYYI